ncbi:MAG: coenzyme F420-dependent oxidoreductase [Salinirussus sp.]|jgi:coenzyme F420-dependent oxidoreductase
MGVYDTHRVVGMTERDVFLPVGAQPSLDALVDQVERAEQLGYDRAWLPESWGREAGTVLATAAERTDEIGLGTSIVNVYSRSPALLGQFAASQQEAADGRFRLGVGPSGPIVIENWHGRDFGNPLRHTRETIEVVKGVLSGEVVDYDGEYHDIEGFRLRCDPPEPAPAVDAAGLGPKAVELAGRFADGWHAVNYTRDGLRERLADLERGAELGDRSVEDIRVTLSVGCCALDDSSRARDLLVQHTAFYIGGMGTYYRDNLARQGYEDVANEIYDAWQEEEREHAKRLVRDELRDQMGAAGTPEEARAELQSFLDIDGVDAVNVSFPRGAEVEEVMRTMEVMAPDV